MKFSIEVKGEEKTTTYTADLGEAERGVTSAVERVKSFLEKTFTRETEESGTE